MFAVALAALVGTQAAAQRSPKNRLSTPILGSQPAAAAAGWEPRMGVLNLFLGLRCAAACVPTRAARATANILVRARYAALLISSALGQLLGSKAS